MSAARRGGGILAPEQARYLESLRPPAPRGGDPEGPVPGAGSGGTAPEVVRFLEALALSTPGGRALELGTGHGSATLALARGLGGGIVTTVDRDAARQGEARARVEAAGLGDRVEWTVGEASELAAGLEGPFDLVYADCEVAEYRRLLDRVLPQVRLGGRLLFDRLLAGGRVADPGLREDETEGEGGADWREAERFNPYLSIHPQLCAVLLPLGDGVGFAVKRRPTRLEMGGPF